MQMEKMKASDTAYEAEIAIITYNNLSKKNLQNSTLRVLLVGRVIVSIFGV